jgi:uncharacterized protein YaiE (UPF0345 family)
MKCLIFDTEKKANTALAQINDNMGMPITGVNAKTKQPAPDSAKTTSWANVEQRSDGKYFFQTPESEYMTDVTYDSEADYSDNWQQYDEEFNLIIDLNLKL